MIDVTSYNTLFLDRDGVINMENSEGYILNWEQFIFYEGVLEALKIMASIFQNIIIVTNQRGVGKGLMTVDDLLNIHTNMVKKIHSFGGRIDNIYFCKDIYKNSKNRKPNIGMAEQAKRDNERIIFSQSIMVGNKLSDMYFGKNIGAKNIFIATTNPELQKNTIIDYYFSSLYEFAKNIQ